eukprot:gb/GECG01000052.1/.p1 GENE.gb/GECG01000052.1/~~gb/GECG01000052.1/.p1  ORF type:complete len:587 (+),score=58.68 gb/GECG01000052.1/:1-1761(+)
MAAAGSSGSATSRKKRREDDTAPGYGAIQSIQQPHPGPGYYERGHLDPMDLTGSVSDETHRPLGTLPFCASGQDATSTAENAIRRIPSSLSVSAFCAMVEWFRVKVDALLDKDGPLEVLSVANDAPEFDAMLVRILAARFKRLRYTIVGVNADSYQPLVHDKGLAQYIRLVDKPYFEWIRENDISTDSASAASATNSSSALQHSFDVIHCAVWRKQFKMDLNEALNSFMSLIKPGGAILSFTFSKAGIFALRDRLWCQIGPPPESSKGQSGSEESDAPWIGLRPEMYVHNWLSEQLRQSEQAADRNNNKNEGGSSASSGAGGSQSSQGESTASTGASGVPSVQSLCAGHRSQLLAWRERVDSHIDITDCVTESFDAAAEAKLNEIIAHDVRAIKARDSEILEDILIELCDMSLAGNGIDEPAVVYAPLDVYLIRAPDSPSDKNSVKSGISDLVHVKESEGLPFFPVDVFSMAAASAPSPVDNVVMLSSWLKNHPQVMRSPHTNTLLCPLKGSWGSFRETGSAHSSALGVMHSEIGAELDKRRRENQEVNSNQPLVRAAHVELDPPSSRLALCKDAWWPHGRYGGFF